MTEKFELKEGKKLRINEMMMYYEEYGEGYPLILLHGGIGTSRVMGWTKQYSEFTKHFRVIAPDSRGHGKSNNPAKTLSYNQMAKDVVALIDELELEKPFICGWSDGGQIALEIALHFPDKVKAIVAGGVLIHISKEYKSGFQAIGIIDPGVVNYEKLDETIPGFSKMLSDTHAPIYGPHYWKELLVEISKMWFNPAEFLDEKVKEITIPTLVLQGDRDEYIPVSEAKRIYELIPNAELSIIPNGKHDLVMKRTEQFNSIVIDYLLRQIEEKKK
ncbi:MAG: alpha/beta fold hydrolase [Candidatus Heimdallarchaeota archaeon]